MKPVKRRSNQISGNLKAQAVDHCAPDPALSTPDVAGDSELLDAGVEITPDYALKLVHALFAVKGGRELAGKLMGAGQAKEPTVIDVWKAMGRDECFSEVVHKALLASMPDHPWIRVAAQMGKEQAEADLAAEGGPDRIDCSISADGAEDGELSPDEMAELIWLLVMTGELPLSEAERQLVELQTKVNGGIPVDESVRTKEIAAMVASSLSIIDEISKAGAT